MKQNTMEKIKNRQKHKKIKKQTTKKNQEKN